MMKKLVANVKFPIDVKAVNPFSNEEPKTYRFMTSIEDLELGDTVVVDTVNGLKIANFVSYSEEPREFGETFGGKSPKYIVQKVDLAAHNARIQAQQQVEILKKKMEARRQKAQELEIYAILAKQDPEMAELLETFKKLQEVL